METSGGRKQPRKRIPDLGDRMLFQHQESLSVFNPSFEDRVKLANRKQTRILTETQGWGLKHFKSLEELLWVFHDAIDDHKQFYYRGVLHRNVSAGSIVILRPPEDGKTGRLIDLDHAKMHKHVHERRKLFKYNLTEDELQSKANAIMADLAEGERDKKPVFVNEWTATAAFKVKGKTGGITYLRIIAERFKIESSKQERIKLSDLHWDLPVENPPSVKNYSAAEDGVHTGTLPYMSHQIVGRISAVRVHDAIHDIESFFWVMVYIALTRAGPGAKNNNPSNTLLFFRYYDNHPEALASVKGSTFSVDDEIAKASMERLFKHFHSYFKDLKPFIEEWQQVIRTAYQFKAFELNTIHEYTKTLIKEAVATLTANPSPELTQQEDDRREAYNRDT